MHINKAVVSGIGLGLIVGFVTINSNAVYAFKSNKDSLPLSQLKKFSEVYTRVKRDYVEEVSDETLITNAIRGMLTGLDPHSDYLDEEEFTELRVGTSGEFGGLGIEVGMEDGFVKVISPIDDTPAQKAGLKAGDLIIRLDDKPVKGLTLNDAVKIMRGKPGDPIELTIIREGLNKPLRVRIVRAIIKVKSVKQKTLEPGYGYIRISSFQSKTTKNIKNAIKKLKQDNKDNLNGVVLDLRNNPGGVLSGAVGVSDVFLTKGKIVYTEGRVKDALMRYDATPDDLIDGAPLVVLVNEGSASASEIVAGALQDHKRALILGKKTFGKGSVQTVLPLDEKTAVKLTTARYFTPSGRSIQAKGIVPDIPVEALELAKTDAEEKDNDKLSALSEADLNRHLENVKSGATKPKKDQEPVTEDNNEDTTTENPLKSGANLAKSDYQLYEALNVLKSMNLAKKLYQNKS